jgi:hypothetical protein
MPINYQQKKNTNTVFGGTDSIIVPVGTTAQRSGTETGQLRYNTDTGLAEFYTATGWAGVDAPPTVSNISGTINENTNSTITITGTNFKTGSVVYITGTAVSNVERALTTTYVNQTQLTADTNATSVNYVGGASFGVKVLNPSGLSGQLDNAGTIDRDPVWSTSAGTLATINDEYGSYSPIATVSASDPDGSTITYSVASGSLPGNVTLNSSTGAISGNPTNVPNATTYTFTVNATSNGQSASRSFNIIVNPALDGSTSARAATSADAINNLSPGNFANGDYWLNLDGTARQYYCPLTTFPGYILMVNYLDGASTFISGAPSGANLNIAATRSTIVGDFQGPNATYGYFRNVGVAGDRSAVQSNFNYSFRYVKVRCHWYNYFSNDATAASYSAYNIGNLGDGITFALDSSGLGSAQHIFTYFLGIQEVPYNCPPSGGTAPTRNGGGSAAPGYMGNRFTCAVRDAAGYTTEYQGNFTGQVGTATNPLNGDSWYDIDLGTTRNLSIRTILHSDQDSSNEEVYLRRAAVLVR